LSSRNGYHPTGRALDVGCIFRIRHRDNAYCLRQYGLTLKKLDCSQHWHCSVSPAVSGTAPGFVAIHEAGDDSTIAINARDQVKRESP
jgi:hypothetical protein